ncbi:hypothetical protein ABIE52_005597 [Rhodococcus sp. OAS809]
MKHRFYPTLAAAAGLTLVFVCLWLGRHVLGRQWR